ncbi:hypothetical protein KPL28_07780 [Clostridium algidicarnis]|nr:hypothetical protein [Clostridium algidicarnis]MBU3209538.1 hypothetical protein [Clostridium algidicarnis]
MDINIKNIKEGIKKDASNFYDDYSEEIENVPKIYYYFDNTSEIQGGAFTGEGIIEFKDLTGQAHEFSHILINYLKWLSEGIANYLDIAYSGLVARDTVSYFLKTKKDENELVKEKSYCGYDKVIKILEENNIDKIMEDKYERIKIVTILDIDWINF